MSRDRKKNGVIEWYLDKLECWYFTKVVQNYSNRAVTFLNNIKFCKNLDTLSSALKHWKCTTHFWVSWNLRTIDFFQQFNKPKLHTVALKFQVTHAVCAKSSNACNNWILVPWFWYFAKQITCDLQQCKCSLDIFKPVKLHSEQHLTLIYAPIRKADT